MNIPLKYRVLEAIAASCDIDGIPQSPTYKAIKERFPKMSTEKMKSIVAKLQEENLLGYPQESHDGEVYMMIPRTAHAVLVEEWEKVEQRKSDIRWRLFFALFGFILGFISGIFGPLVSKLVGQIFGL